MPRIVDLPLVTNPNPSDSIPLEGADGVTRRALLSSLGIATAPGTDLASVSSVYTLTNDGTHSHALVLTSALHVFTSGSGALAQPDGEIGVWHTISNFTGNPLTIYPQDGAVWMDGQPLVLQTGYTVSVIAINSTQSLWK